MNLKKTLAGIVAFLMIAVMALSLVGCVNSYANNPLVAKVGNVKLYLNDYMTIYNNSNYSQYLQYGLMDRKQYADFILDTLVMQGVQLDQLEKQNITLDAEEEAKALSDAADEIKEYVDSNYLSKVDASITDDAARYEAALELFKAYLVENGTNYEDYVKSVEDSFRQSARLQKLNDLTVKDVTVTTDEVKTYITDQVKTSVTASDFYTSWSSFVSLSAKTAPLFMPHPERAVEDDPETADKDESQDADPYAEFFSVKHLLYKFKTQAEEGTKDLAEYADNDKEASVRMSKLEEELTQLDTQKFLDMIENSEINEDPGMAQPSYQYFGYIMQSSLLDKYYDGFGYAAMKLKFGEDWKSDKEKEALTSTAEEGNDGPEYEVTILELADGNKIAKVFTTTGVHYIILNENDIFGMYDDEGYLMLPVYENDSPVTDGEGVVTVNGGHITSEQIETVDEILANLKPAETDEETETEPVTLKSMYQYYYDAKLSSAQNSFYSTKVTEWKENTRIVKKENVLKAFYQG